MIRIFTIIVISILATMQLQSQTALYCENCGLTLSGGVELYVIGDFVDNSTDASKLTRTQDNSTLIVTGDIIHNGTQNLFAIGDRTTVSLRNNAQQFITGTSNSLSNFYDLTIEQGSDKVLNKDISVNRNLSFIQGNVDLNGQKLELVLDPFYGAFPLFGATLHEPSIVGETGSNRIFGTNGSVELQEMLGSSYLNSSKNIANIGAEVMQSGMTQIGIQRAHQIQSVNTSNSIQRYYDIESTNPSTSGGSLKFNYLEGPQTDLLGITDESDLVFFKRNISSLGILEGGAPWLNDSIANIDIDNNVATNTNIENLTNERFTLVECQAPALAASASADSVCVNTSVTLDAGTDTGWTYSWSNGATTQTIDVSENFMVTKKYYVTVTDARGCFARDSLTVSWLDFPTASFPNLTESVCDGSNIDLNPTTTGSQLSYLWSTGETTPTITHVSDGTQSINYSVTVTSYDRCDVIASVQVDDVMNPVVDLGPDIVNCEGLPQTLMAGPASGFTYNWTDGEFDLGNTNQITVSQTGLYFVTITDLATTCSAEDDIRVGISDIQISFTKDDILCNGSPAGNIFLTIQGISGDFTVDWSNGDQTVDLLGVEAGTYSVTVADMEGCSDSIKNIVITEQPAIIAAPVIVDDLCDLGTGSIISNLSGGTPPYASIEWYDQNQQGGPFATTPDVSGLSFGDYVLSVIDDNGCMYDEIFTIAGGPINPTYTTQVNQITCPEADDGSLAILNLAGGNAPYTYTWSNNASGSTITDLSAGAYSVSATDVNGCLMLTENFTIVEPDDVTVTLDELTRVDCFGNSTGALDISVNGVAQYSVLWTTGADTEIIDALSAGLYTVTVTFGNSCTKVATFEVTEPTVLDDNPVITDDFCRIAGGSISTRMTGGFGLLNYFWSNGESTPDISSLKKGDYTVTVVDAKSCTFTATYQVDDLPPLVLFPGTIDLLCADDNSGVVVALHNGGTEPLEYLWSNGETGDMISDLPPGSYTVNATDANGCMSFFTTTVQNAASITIFETIIDASSTESDDGSIALNVAGGTGEYSYLWSTGATTQDISGLGQGVYSVTIQDGNDCTQVGSYVVSAPTLINSSAIINNPNCNGDNSGSIDLSVDGATAPYTFEWSDGSTSEDLENISAGNYTVTITSTDGIVAFEAFEIVEPDALSIIFNKVDVSCNNAGDGSISVETQGGTGDLSFSWSNDSQESDLSALAAGIYTLTITDQNGCQISESIEVSQPLPITLIANSTNISEEGASDGSASVSVSGGNEPYSYLWSNGEISDQLSELSGGTYTITVTDNNGCEEEASVSVLDPSSIMVLGETMDLTCFGDEDGSIDLMVEGGNEPFSYEWSNGATSEDLTGLMAGNYSVTLTDADGLIIVKNYSILAPTEITIDDVMMTNVDCGDATGSIIIEASGGAGALSYSWSSGETVEQITMKEAGSYTVTITDESACELIREFEITANTNLTLTAESMNSSCGENFDGSIDLMVEGGTAPYSYLWSTGQISEDLNNLGPGTYDVTVTDNNNCNTVTSVVIEGGSSFTLQGAVQDVGCFNANDGSIELTIEGGSPEFSFQWSNGATTQNLENLDRGTYDVTVTDGNGCSASSTFVIVEPGSMVLNLSSSLAGCSSDNDGSISVIVSGGAAPYSYAWSTGANSQTITGLSPGSYSVTVVDVNGCPSEISTSVQQTDQMLEARFLVASPVRETETLQFLDLSVPKPNSWLWRFGSPKNVASTEEDPLFRYPNNPDIDESTYTATLIVSSVACIDSTSKEVRIINTRRPGDKPETIEEPFYTEISSVKVYPNPTSDYLNTEVVLNQEDKVEIRLVSLNGQVIRHYTMSASQVYYERINVSGLMPGYYFVYVTSGADTEIKKVAVVR